jgi:hypothetical protein
MHLARLGRAEYNPRQANNFTLANSAAVWRGDNISASYRSRNAALPVGAS